MSACVQRMHTGGRTMRESDITASVTFANWTMDYPIVLGVQQRVLRLTRVRALTAIPGGIEPTRWRRALLGACCGAGR